MDQPLTISIRRYLDKDTAHTVYMQRNYNFMSLNYYSQLNFDICTKFSTLFIKQTSTHQQQAMQC